MSSQPGHPWADQRVDFDECKFQRNLDVVGAIRQWFFDILVATGYITAWNVSNWFGSVILTRKRVARYSASGFSDACQRVFRGFARAKADDAVHDKLLPVFHFCDSTASRLLGCWG